MIRPKVETVARRHINRLRMEDKAYFHIYQNPVFHSYRVALIALLRECAHRRYEKHPETGVPLIDQKRVEGKVSASTNPPQSMGKVGRILLEAIELGLISKIARGDGPTQLRQNKAYLFFSSEQWEKVKRLNELFDQIDLVIDAQSAQPDDKWAGRDHVPREVYYNIDGDDGL